MGSLSSREQPLPITAEKYRSSRHKLFMEIAINFGKLCGNEKPLPLYIFRVALFALLPAQLIFSILENFGLIIGQVDTRANNSFSGIIVHYIDLLLLTPWIETLLMVVVFFVLRVCRVPSTMLLWVSALAWAALHSYTRQLAYGVVVFWPFVMFSAIFLKHELVNRNHAVVYTSVVHCAYNILSLVFHWNI